MPIINKIKAHYINAKSNFGPLLNQEDLDKRNAIKKLIEESNITIEFIILLIISSVIATLGLILNSAAIVIGAMLITPFMTPVLALGLGIVTFNPKSIVRSITAFIISTSINLIISIGLTLAFSYQVKINFEILQRIEPSFLLFTVAYFSGFAATYAWIRPKLSASLPGTAISVALLPPLCTVGIGLAITDYVIMTNAFWVFVYNVLGILLAAVVVFAVFGFHKLKKVEQSSIELEELEKEESEVN
jgi:uncharacterized hydrophobic protein (TIGR00271 family)